MRPTRRTICLWRTAAALLLLASLTPIAHAEAITESRYKALLERMDSVCSSESPSPAALRKLADDWARVDSVRFAGGKKIEFDGRREARLLREWAAAPKVEARSNSTLLRVRLLQEGMLSPTESASGGDPAAEAKSIVARTEFLDRRDDEGESWLERKVKEWMRSLDRWLRKLGPRRSREPSFDGLQGFAYAIRFVLYFLAGLAAVLLVYLLVRSLMGSGLLVRRKKVAKAAPIEEPDLIADEIPDPLGAARRAADTGDFRSAVRLSYIACLRRLRDQGFIVQERFRTNWEYQDELQRRSPDHARSLLPATRLFDRSWYGGYPTTRAGFESVIAVFDALAGASDSSGKTGGRP